MYLRLTGNQLSHFQACLCAEKFGDLFAQSNDVNAWSDEIFG